MPEKRECTFCGNPIEPGTGTIHIKNNGHVLHLCNSKCKRNIIDLGRKARETEWTKNYAQEKAIKTYRKKDKKKGKKKGKKKVIKKKK